MTDMNNSTRDKDSLIAQAHEVMAKQLERCSVSSENSLSDNAVLLVAITYALQVIRGDENVSAPQIGVEGKPQSFRATGFGIVSS